MTVREFCLKKTQVEELCVFRDERCKQKNYNQTKKSRQAPALFLYPQKGESEANYGKL